jgi:OHCU decarboxylase
MAQRRPFHDVALLRQAADQLWWDLGPEDWLEAFSAHPRIGQGAGASAQQAEARRWSEQEQSGTRGAASETMAALAESNRAYEERFGFIFIVCATGRSAAEMLALLEERLENAPDAELRVAAEEQRRITHLRLEKLLQS